MRGPVAAPGVLLAVALTLLPAHASIGEQQAKTAALQFGRALTRAETSLLRQALPTRGKITLRLVRFGPEDGAYSSDQVEALFKDFLRQGQVRSFDLLRVQSASEQFARVQARVHITDREGRPGEVDLHLSFQPEDGRWVLREIREASP